MSLARAQSWVIAGADAEPIIGDSHVPQRAVPNGHVVICHGFKGYKDYGMIPRIAQELAARTGVISHRFNFSHSGMSNEVAAFARPDLFELDTWNKQVFDLHAVIGAVRAGVLPGDEAKHSPIVLVGHSRGGVTAILAASRLTEVETLSDQHAVAGIITLAAPSTCNPLTPWEQSEMLTRGWIESSSSRTGQRLRVGRAFLREQIADPDGHDVLLHVGRLPGPLMVIHGDHDATVPVTCAQQLVHAARCSKQLRVIRGADHVFNTPNPLASDAPSSPQLGEVLDVIESFITQAFCARPKVL